MTDIDSELLQRLSRLKGSGCPPLAALGRYLDQTLAGTERTRIARHLAACPACLNRLIELRELALLERAGEEPPAALMRALRSKLPASEAAQRPASAASGRTQAIAAWLRGYFGRQASMALAAAVFAGVAVTLIVLQRPVELTPAPKQIASDYERAIVSSPPAPEATPAPRQAESQNDRASVATAIVQHILASLGTPSAKGFISLDRPPERAEIGDAYFSQAFSDGIVGVFRGPDAATAAAWLVYAGGEMPAYAATGRINPTAIDTVALPSDPQWTRFTLYEDIDCDGDWDRYRHAGGAELSEPPAIAMPAAIAALMPELVDAVGAGVISAQQLTICGDSKQR